MLTDFFMIYDSTTTLHISYYAVGVDDEGGGGGG